MFGRLSGKSWNNHETTITLGIAHLQTIHRIVKVFGQGFAGAIAIHLAILTEEDLEGTSNLSLEIHRSSMIIYNITYIYNYIYTIIYTYDWIRLAWFRFLVAYNIL